MEGQSSADDWARIVNHRRVTRRCPHHKITFDSDLLTEYAELHRFHANHLLVDEAVQQERHDQLLDRVHDFLHFAATNRNVQKLQNVFESVVLVSKMYIIAIYYAKIAGLGLSKDDVNDIRGDLGLRWDLLANFAANPVADKVNSTTESQNFVDIYKFRYAGL